MVVVVGEDVVDHEGRGMFVNRLFSPSVLYEIYSALYR